jgi:hypothetical protein
MKKLMKTLEQQCIFTSEVASANIAHHCKYISSAGPLLLTYLKQVECIHYSENLRNLRSLTS